MRIYIIAIILSLVIWSSLSDYLKVSSSYKSSLIVKISNKLNRMYYSQRILFSIGIQFRASESFQTDTHSLICFEREWEYIYI